MKPELFHNDEAGRKAFSALASRAVAWIAGYYSRIETLPVRSQVKPGEIYAQFPDKFPAQPIDEDEVFRILDEVIIPGITHWQHPHFYAFFPGNTSFPSIAAETLTAGLAAQCMLWESSPAAAELEQRCMEWCRDLLGLPTDWSGVIQDTASSATLTALLTAREWISEFRISTKGFDGRVIRVYASAQAHSSIEKAVRLAGFGTDNLVYIEVDEKMALRADALKAAIEKDIDAGYIPVCVVSTIGTTATGAIDPVEDISAITKQFDIWHHVDAAYAGTAMMLEEYAYLRAGLEGADSFVFNPHKWMFVQFDCSVYFIRKPELLVKTMSINPAYLMTAQGTSVNDYRDWGIPLGRRFRALKLWMTVHLLGTDAIKERLRFQIGLAQKVEALLMDDLRLELVYPRALNILTFRISTALDPDGVKTKELSKAINDSGRAYMTHTVVENRNLLRWVIGQTNTAERHIDDTWQLLDEFLGKIIAT